MPKTSCPRCDQRLTVPESSETLKVRCPKCAFIFSSRPTQAEDDGTPGRSWLVPATAVVVIAAAFGLTFTVAILSSSPIEDQVGGGPVRDGIAATADPLSPDGSGPAEPSTRAAPPQLESEPDPPPRKQSLTPEEIFNNASPAVVRVVVRDRAFRILGFGSGFFISPDGTLVTNQHVVADAEFVTVLLDNDQRLAVNSIVATDESRDLALLKVDRDQLPSLTLATDGTPAVGVPVFAIGNPKGLTNTLSTGIVSGHRRFGGSMQLIQTTAAISSGSSGGPLLNGAGEVVGVTSANVIDGQNLNFAVPVTGIAQMGEDASSPRPLASMGGGNVNDASRGRLETALDALASGDLRNAATLLSDIKAQHADNPVYWYARGRLRMETGDLVLAESALQRAIELQPGHVFAHIDLGETLAGLGRWEHARTAFEAATRIDPHCAEAWEAIGHVCIITGDFAEAVEHFWKAAEVSPDYTRAYIFLAHAHLRSDPPSFDNAMKAARTAVQLNPDYAMSHVALADVFIRLNMHDEARHILQSASQMAATDAPTQFVFALCYEAIGDYERARQWAEAALRQVPTEPIFQMAAGRAAFEAGDASAAIGFFKRAIALEKSRTAPGLLKSQGPPKGNRPGRPVWYAFKPIALDTAYNLLAFAYDEAGDLTQAIEHWRRALEANPEDPVLVWNLGISLSEAGEHDEALGLLTKYLSFESISDHERADAHDSIALIHKTDSNVDEAITHWTQAVEHAPDNAYYRWKLGETLYYNRDSKKAALHHLRAYLRLKPQGEHASDASDIIRRSEAFTGPRRGRVIRSFPGPMRYEIIESVPLRPAPQQ